MIGEERRGLCVQVLRLAARHVGEPRQTELDLSVRVFNSLKRTGITSVGDVLDMLQRGPDAMLAIRNFGEKSLDELEEKLAEKNYWPLDRAE